VNKDLLKYADTLRASNNITLLSNASAYLNSYIDDINWVGFYLYDGSVLYLGPFQGKVACQEIKMGKGVCGTAAFKRETIVVPNVLEFEGHIACDSNSRSEIVVPIIIDEKLFGVLDIDSANFNRFNEEDKKILEQFIEIIKEYIKL